jgi:hypothetical protein
MNTGNHDKGEVSDGYHTFNELYAHRRELFFTLCKALKSTNNIIWRSKLHHEIDTDMYEGMFIMGINTDPLKQISYHIDLKFWNDANFAETFERAPKWDGHSASDTLERLKNLVRN